MELVVVDLLNGPQRCSILIFLNAIHKFTAASVWLNDIHN